MKNVLTLLFTLSCSLPAVAQASFDYMLFRPGVQYSYGSIEAPDGGLLPTYAGVRLTGNGAERIAPTARQVSVTDGQARMGDSYFGSSVYQLPDSTSLAYENFTVHLRPAAQIGESWNINPSYEATVDSIREETFFALTDSVKYISFRATDGTSPDLPRMRISKSYGLLNAVDFALRDNPNLELAGMSSPEVGLQVPTFKSLTNFQVGDELHKEFINRTVDNDGRQQLIVSEQQLTVERVERVSDSLVRVHFLLHELTYESAGAAGNIDSIFDGFQTEIVAYNLRDQPYLDGQFNEVYDWENGGKYVLIPASSRCGDEGNIGMELAIFNVTDAGLLNYFPFGTGGFYYPRVAGPYNQFVEGSHRINGLEYQRNDAGTCGTAYDFMDLIDGTNELSFDERIRLSPNPANDQVTVQIPVDLGRVSLGIYGAAGRLLRGTDGRTGDQMVSLAGLASGLYTVVVVNDSGWVGRRKLFVR